MFEPKIKLSRELFEKVGKLAAARGYSSADELVVHVLEKAVADAETAASEEEVRKRLKGLGYVG